MDYGRVLRRSWHITLKYRALWVFGILLALFSGGWRSGGGGGNGNAGGSGGGIGAIPGMPFSGNVSAATVAGIIAVVVLTVILFVIVFAIGGTILRYLSETALIRMVNTTEDTGEKLSWKRGFRLGWSRAALRLFLIDVVIAVPLAIAFVVLGVLALMPLIAWAFGDTTVGVIGTVATIGLVALLVLLGILVALLLSLVRPFIYRTAVLRDLGVFESIKQGLSLVRSRFAHAGTMWLIMVGVQIAFGLAMIVVALVLLVVAGLVGAIPALGVYAVGATLVGQEAAVGLAALVAVPLFLVVLGVPTLFISGLWQVYQSSVWTLTFRELSGPTSVAAVEEPLAEGPVDIA